MPQTETDCRTDVGIAVGIVDALITQCRMLKRLPKEIVQSYEVQEALKDLSDDEDFNSIKELVK